MLLTLRLMAEALAMSLVDLAPFFVVFLVGQTSRDHRFWRGHRRPPPFRRLHHCIPVQGPPAGFSALTGSGSRRYPACGEGVTF